MKNMNKKQKSIISVAKLLATIIGSRDVVDLLKAPILEASSSFVVLSFRNVEFVSRSAAHELLLLKEEVCQKNKKIVFEDTNKDITKMLRVVAANRALPKLEKIEFNAEKVNIKSLLKKVAV